MRLPAYGQRLGRARFAVVDREVMHVAFLVARLHAGKHRRDRARHEYPSTNIKTWHKYVHVVRMWF